MPTPLNSNLAVVVQELQATVETLTEAANATHARQDQLDGRLQHIEQHLQGGGGPGFNIKF
jgi:chaperonin cofactor prefoldin